MDGTGRHIVLAHARNDAELARQIAEPLEHAGYRVVYENNVLVGESVTAESAKALSLGAPVVLCGTARAAGSKFTRRLVNAAQGSRQVFAVQMDEDADLEHLALDTVVAQYWQIPGRAITELLVALRKHYPPTEGDEQSSTLPNTERAFIDQPSGAMDFDIAALEQFRAELREDILEDLTSHLDPIEFLRRANLMQGRVLTHAGVLMFGKSATNSLPSALVQCVLYHGQDPSASRDRHDFAGTIPGQIVSARDFVASRIKKVELPVIDSARTSVMYEYPMVCVREVVANALVHRDYQDDSRNTHCRIFTDRIEVVSAGRWMATPLEPGVTYSLDQLWTESSKRNFTLAKVLSWIRLVEGEGSGIPAAVKNCREIGAPIPEVLQGEGFVKVVIRPVKDWPPLPESVQVTSEQPELLITYARSDLPWARWIAWELEAGGYTILLQETASATSSGQEVDYGTMHQAPHAVVVLTSTSMANTIADPQWIAALNASVVDGGQHLIFVRTAEHLPEALKGRQIDVDLVELDESEARSRLLEGIAEALGTKRKLATPPSAPVTISTKPRFPSALPPVWNVPYRRNPTFIGREEALARLAQQLGLGVAATVTQAIQGIGGVGKTALAVEYAYRHRAEFDTVWWVRAEEPASLVRDYGELATALSLPGASDVDQQAGAQAVRHWLESHERWLLILDNALSPHAATGLRAPLAHLTDLLPRVIQGQVLVTSRDASWDEQASLVELDVLTPEEAVRFLLRRTGSNDQEAAAEVAQLLGNLPLALEQAGAYVRETGLPPSAYLARLHEFPEQILARGRPRDRDPADMVATTWRVSLERVESAAGAVALLEVCAYLAPDDIPRDLFTERVDGQSEEMATLATDAFALDQAIGELRRYSLVKVSPQGLNVHRLLQQIIRDGLNADTATERVALAVRLLGAAFPRQALSDVRTWPLCQRLLPHVLSAAAHAEHLATEPLQVGDLLDRAASYLQGRGRYTEARGLFQRALTLTEQALGGEDARTGTHLNNLGLLLLYAGDYPAAKASLERSLVIKQATRLPDDPEVATTLDNLGLALHAVGDLDGARQQLEHALAIKQAALGPDHPSVGTALANLGVVLQDLGDVDGARQQLEHALAIKQAALGPDHPEVATTLANLGMVLQDLGDLDGARQQLQHALEIQETVLGPDHPEVATTLANLGLLLQDLGDLDGARQQLERALAIQETALGRDHEKTQAVARSVTALQPNRARTESTGG